MQISSLKSRTNNKDPRKNRSSTFCFEEERMHKKRRKEKIINNLLRNLFNETVPPPIQRRRELRRREIGRNWNSPTENGFERKLASWRAAVCTRARSSRALTTKRKFNRPSDGFNGIASAPPR